MNPVRSIIDQGQLGLSKDTPRIVWAMAAHDRSKWVSFRRNQAIHQASNLGGEPQFSGREPNEDLYL